MVEVMKITSFKRSQAHTATLGASNPAAGHHQPTPLPETPGPSRASLGQSLVGSLLLSPGSWCTQGSVCALQESVSPVLYKFWQLCGGLMVTSSKRAYAIPRSSAPKAPAPAAAVHCELIAPQEMFTTLNYCCCSATQSCLTLCHPMDCSTPGIPVYYQLLELAQTHVHPVSNAIQPVHPLSCLSPPAFNLLQHQGLFK